MTVANERLSLPFTGITSFCKVPVHTDLDTVDADVAILGVPFDMSTQYRSGTRFGPRAIRSASAYYAGSRLTYYDHEFDMVFLEGVRIVDCGDVDIIHMRPETCLQNVYDSVRRIVGRGVLPVILGGDHAVTIPVVRALEQKGPLYIIQIDAHLDFVDERFGVREGHGNVMRRVAEMQHVEGFAQLGVRGPGSSGPADFEEAKRRGGLIIGPRELRRRGSDGAVSLIPPNKHYYVTIDIDAFDPSIAPGSGSPSFGGLSYYEVTDLLRGIAAKGKVLGFDLVEVAPQYDPAEVTAHLAARVILDFLGAIWRLS